MNKNFLNFSVFSIKFSEINIYFNKLKIKNFNYFKIYRVFQLNFPKYISISMYFEQNF